MIKGVKIICETSTNTPKPFIPLNLRKYVYMACHDFDHCGQRESTIRASSSYFWPKLNKDVAHYVSTCHPCQSIKSVKKFIPKARTFDVPDRRFSQLHIDVVGPLPPSEGMSYILSIFCRTSKWLECIPMPSATSANCAKAFVRGWLARYGAADQIFSDNGNTFVAKLWEDLNKILGIKVTFVPRYHQATNGAVERQHRTLKDSIKGIDINYLKMNLH